MIIIDKKIELTEQELEKAMEDKGYNGFLYIVSFRAIYEITYSVNGGWQWKRIYTTEKDMTKRGRFFFKSAFEVNQILGLKVLNDGSIEYKGYYIKKYSFGAMVFDEQYKVEKVYLYYQLGENLDVLTLAKEYINNLNKNI